MPDWLKGTLQAILTAAVIGGGGVALDVRSRVQALEQEQQQAVKERGRQDSKLEELSKELAKLNATLSELVGYLKAKKEK